VNRKTFIKLSACAFLALPVAAQAQNIQCPTGLDFGEIIGCAGGGSVTIRPTQGRTITGCLAAADAAFSTGRCTVTQPLPLNALQISVIDSAIDMDGESGQVSVGDFKLMNDAGGEMVTSTAASLSVPLGATLRVKPGQTAGSYAGTFTINVNYQ